MFHTYSDANIYLYLLNYAVTFFLCASVAVFAPASASVLETIAKLQEENVLIIVFKLLVRTSFV